jgi:ATP-binding cassette subfamily B protein
MHYLWTVGGKMGLIALAAAASGITLGLISARVGSAIGRDLRRDVFAKVVSFSHTELEHLSTASLITRCTNDIVQVQFTCVLLLRMVLYAPIMGIGGVTKVIAADSGLGWIVAAAVGGLFLLLMVLLLVAMPKFKKMQTLVDNVNLVSREILTGLPVIRAFARERYEEQRFDGANTALRNTQLFTGRTMAAMMPFMNLIMYGISIAIIWFGAHEIQAGTLEIGDMMAFTNYAMQIVFSFMMLSMISIMAPRAIVAADRIYEVLETENVIAEPQRGMVTVEPGMT